MAQITHQTVRLGKGKHASAQEGACVMELASMLAGESFSDHPLSVSRSIAAFLRGYNDLLDDDRRQDLYEYAARVVGTAGPRYLENLRAERLIEWADELRERRRWAILPRIERRLRPERPAVDPETAARRAIRAVRRISDSTHGAVLKLIDELIEIGSPPSSPAIDSVRLRRESTPAGRAAARA